MDGKACAWFLTGCLFLFFSVHAYMDMTTKGKRIPHRKDSSMEGIRPSAHIIGIVVSTLVFWAIFCTTPLLIFLEYYDDTFRHFVIPLLYRPPIQGIGTIILGLGVLLADWGRVSRGKMAPSTFDVSPDFMFTRRGAYAVVRHPMYLSYYLMVAGLFLLTANAVLLVCVVGYPSYYVMARHEEKFLEKRFPEYEEYKKEVGMFLPRWHGRI